MVQKLSSFNPDQTECQWFIGDKMLHEDFWPIHDGLKGVKEAIKHFEGLANEVREVMALPNIRDLHIERESDYEGGYYLMLKWEYLETPEQRDERLATDKRYADERVAKERAELNRLQAKYGPKSP